MTLRTADHYVGLITSKHADKPNFTSMVGQVVQPFVDLQAFIASLPMAFDVDHAIGVQLDIVGQWVGVSRDLPVPVANLYFAVGIAGVGVGQGYLRGPYSDAVTISALDDGTYLRLIYSKIAANNADGTTPTIQVILNAYFIDPATYVIVQDNATTVGINLFFSVGDAARGLGGPALLYEAGLAYSTLPASGMSMTIGIAGKIPSLLDLEVLAQGKLPLTTMGIDSQILVTSVDQQPLFGIGASNQYIDGIGRGCLGTTPAYLAGLLTGEYN